MSKHNHHPFADLPNVTELLDRACAGDMQATSDVIDLVYSFVQRSVRLIRRRFPGIQNLETTEADTNEVLMRILLDRRDSRKPFQSRKEFLNACFTTARNLLVDRLRAAQRADLQAIYDTQQASAGSAEEELRRREDIDAFRVILEQLESEDYTLVSLIYFVGMSQTDAFRLLEIPEATGRYRLSKIKVQLAQAARGVGLDNA